MNDNTHHKYKTKSVVRRMFGVRNKSTTLKHCSRRSALTSSAADAYNASDHSIFSYTCHPEHAVHWIEHLYDILKILDYDGIKEYCANNVSIVLTSLLSFPIPVHCETET